MKKAKKAMVKKMATAKVMCPSCGRLVEIERGRGRCECSQGLMVRAGRPLRIRETPKGCVDLPAAKTIEQAKPKAEPKAKRERTDGKMSGLDAAAKVLADAGDALDTKTMVERMLAQGLWSTGGKTPAATIYSAILREIAKGESSRFKKADRGKFALAS